MFVALGHIPLYTYIGIYNQCFLHFVQRVSLNEDVHKKAHF